jgi:hypothetical protein
MELTRISDENGPTGPVENINHETREVQPLQAVVENRVPTCGFVEGAGGRLLVS